MCCVGMQVHAYAALSDLEVAEDPHCWVVVVRMCRHGFSVRCTKTGDAGLPRVLPGRRHGNVEIAVTSSGQDACVSSCQGIDQGPMLRYEWSEPEFLLVDQ
jgi:hypothetical protein